MAAKQIGGGIVIFDTNTGGGGGGLLTASEGLQAIGTDVQMGGNPINKFVGIELTPGTGAELTIGDPVNIWGFDISNIGADPADIDIFIGAADNGAAPTTESLVNITKGEIQLQMFANATAASNIRLFPTSVNLSVSDNGTGHTFSFAISDTGGSLTGVFSDNDQHIGPQKDASILAATQLANSNAYITTDCLGSIITGANNGVSLFGTTVQLGGPLIKNTIIDATGFHFDIITNAVATPGSVFSVQNGAIGLEVTNAAHSLLANLGIDASTGPAAITITDQIFALGMTKDNTIPAANQLANAKAYVTTDCLSLFAGQIVGTVNQRLQTTAQTFTLYNVPGGHNQLLAIDIAFFNNSLPTGNNSLALVYTDEAGTVQTINLGSFSTINAQPIAPQVIYAEKGTAVQLVCGISVAANYNVYASATFLNVQN